jgi:hypothetical protein
LVLKGAVSDAFLVARFGGPGGGPIDLVVQISLRTRRVTIDVMEEKRLRIGDDGNVIGTIVVSKSDPLEAIVEFLDRDPLISRSQAKRVLARLELFRTVLFDFSRDSCIGQAFSDEIFRVFAHAHPTIELQFAHANAAIRQMISRARSAETRRCPSVKDAAPTASRARKPRRRNAEMCSLRNELRPARPCNDGIDIRGDRGLLCRGRAFLPDTKGNAEHG